MQCVATDVVGSLVCVYVETRVSCAKMAESIELPFGGWLNVGPRNHALDGGSHPPLDGALLRGHMLASWNMLAAGKCACTVRVVIDIFWESTLVFFVAYKPANSGSMEQPWLVQVTLAVSKQFLPIAFAAARAYKMAMWPVARLLWTSVFITCTSDGDRYYFYRRFQVASSTEST